MLIHGDMYLFRDDAWAVEPLPWEILPKHFDSEMRAWNVLGGAASHPLPRAFFSVDILSLDIPYLKIQSLQRLQLIVNLQKLKLTSQSLSDSIACTEATYRVSA